MNRLPAPLRRRFIAWSALMLGVLGLGAFQVLPDLALETDVLALLPRTQQDRDLDTALQSFSAGLARQQIFLVGADNADEARRAAEAFAHELLRSGEFATVRFELELDLRRRVDVYLRHRAWLLSPEDRQVLAAGEFDRIRDRALRAAYTPMGLMQPMSLAEDPLGLIGRFLRNQVPALGRAQIEDSVLTVDHGGRRYLLVAAEVSGSAFATEVQDRVMPVLEAARTAARAAAASPVDIVSSGALRHAAAAADRARREISTFGALETLAVVLLMVAVFGALRPLLLGAITLALAVGSAFTIVHLLFGQVHLLTLVFGSSLIGSVIDYSIHFLADRFRDPKRWTPADALSHVGPAILLGLIATLIGYAVLALVPFPGLEQIAVFCMTGLVAGCGSVLCLYPVLARASARRPPELGPRIGRAIDEFLRRWRWDAMKLAVTVALAVAVAVGLTRLRVEDDVRSLQHSPPQLVAEEQRVRELLGSGLETRFFLVTGDTAQAALESTEELSRTLDDLVRAGALTYYQSVTRSLPSLAQQRRDRDLLSRTVYAPGALLEQVMGDFGFEPAAIEKRRREFAGQTGPLDVDEWLADPASEGLRHLWLGRAGDRYASIVTLGGIRDVAALEGAESGNARLFDRVAETTDILGRYRHMMSWLLAAIYCIAGLVLLVRFGWRTVPRMLLPSIAATLTTLGLFGWLGVPFNLFTLLALWLVLGLGIDYGIFLHHGRASRPTAILSVTLSACTTLIAFGLLAFSTTPFIRSIGTTLLVTITLSWSFVLISSLTGLPHDPQRDEKTS